MKLNRNMDTCNLKENHKIEEIFNKNIEEPIIEEPSEPVFEEKDGIVVACTSLYVRSAAHTNATPNDVVSEGARVKIIGEEGDFWKIDSPSGYCMKKFIKIV